MAQGYTSVHVHVPEKAHENFFKAITQSTGLSINLDLTKNPDYEIFVTPLQKKIEEAIAKGRKKMSLRFTGRQAQYNKHVEGGFSGAIPPRNYCRLVGRFSRKSSRRGGNVFRKT